jgi:signal transduction histidine kinase
VYQGRPNPALEHEVERLSARVAQLEREKADVEAFAAIAAHELLEPLVMAEAYVAMVCERLDEHRHADSRRDLDALSRGSARTRLVIESLLHDARTSGRALSRRAVDLNTVLGDCLLVLAPEIEARGLHIEVGRLPTVACDQGLILGVFRNLLLNALKYSPRRAGAIHVGVTEETGERRFFVESDGPTIPPEDREAIFEPFHRGKDERRARGSGLGLTICRSIVERHGGTIGVSAATGNGGGRGNRFYFTLPGA